MRRIVWFLVGSSLFLSVTAFPQSKREKKLQKQQEVKELVESAHFRFSANSMTPLGDNLILLNGPYEVDFDSLLIKSFLPYYGRVYMPQLGGVDGGVKFEEKAESLVIQSEKRGYRIMAYVTDDKDTYQLSLSVGLDGYASLNITFIHRQSISYRGVVEKIEEQ